MKRYIYIILGIIAMYVVISTGILQIGMNISEKHDARNSVIFELINK